MLTIVTYGSFVVAGVDGSSSGSFSSGNVGCFFRCTNANSIMIKDKNL